MAYLPDDPNQPAGGTPNPTAVGGNVTGGSGAYAGGGGSGGQGATTSTSPAPTASGHFTNLSSYLTANASAPGSAASTNQGQAVENVLNAAGQGATNAINTYGQDASAQIGTAPTVTPDMESQIAGTGFSTNAPTAYQGPADTNSFTGKAATDQAQAYGSLQNLLGTGPGQATPAAGQVATPNSMIGQATGEEAGVSALNSELFKQPSYTSGENSLDTFLTGNAPGQAAAKSYGGLTGQLGNENENLQNQINTTQQNTGYAVQKYNNDVDDYNTNAAALAAQQALPAAASATAGPGPQQTSSTVAQSQLSKLAAPSSAASKPGTLAIGQNQSAAPNIAIPTSNPAGFIPASSVQNPPATTQPGTLDLNMNIPVVAGHNSTTPTGPSSSKTSGTSTGSSIGQVLGSLPGLGGFAANQGGKVPSYSQLSDMLKKGKK